jgi:hypothetical protein
VAETLQRQLDEQRERYAFIDLDTTRRAEPGAIVEAVRRAA